MAGLNIKNKRVNMDVYEHRLIKVDSPRDMDQRQEFFINKAAQVAYRSPCLHQHGAVIVNRNTDEILATGYNKMEMHYEHMFSLHAEVDAIRKVKKHVDLTNAEMYVVRIGPPCQPLKMSRPCTECEKFILKRGIGKVYYSWGDCIDYGDKKFTNFKEKK